MPSARRRIPIRCAVGSAARGHTGNVRSEVDFVLEDDAGRCVGVEVKASASVGPRDFRGLRFLRDSLGEAFVRGVVLYTGRETVPFGERLHAVPIAQLWAARR